MYFIILSNGTQFTTIDDNTVDTTSSLALLGRNYRRYGGYVAENFVYLLERFADSVPPTLPLIGQVWFDTSDHAHRLQVWTGTEWTPCGLPIDDEFFDSITIEATTVDNIGFEWYDPAAPVDSRRYRIRTRDDPPYAGHFVLESLHDDRSIKAVVFDTDSDGAAKLAVSPGSGDNSTRMATTGYVASNYAALASPALTGTPTTPTPDASDSSTRLATTAYVAQSFAKFGSPAFSGTPMAPTPAASDNSAKLATTEFVTQNFAPLASPAFSGTPSAPSPISSDNSTRIATTAYVKANLSVIQGAMGPPGPPGPASFVKGPPGAPGANSPVAGSMGPQGPQGTTAPSGVVSRVGWFSTDGDGNFSITFGTPFPQTCAFALCAWTDIDGTVYYGSRDQNVVGMWGQLYWVGSTQTGPQPVCNSTLSYWAVGW